MLIHDANHTLYFGTRLDEARGAIILIHGRGASAEDIAGLSEALPAEGLSFLVPDALHGTWYPQRFFVPLQENEPHLSSGLELIGHLIAEIKEAGIPLERVAIVGFSQGGCLGLEYAFRNPGRYGFVAGLSSALIGPAGTPRPETDLQQTPVLVACAEGDPHIPLPFVEESVRTLSASNADVTRQIFPGYDHTIFPEEIEWLAAHIKAWSK